MHGFRFSFNHLPGAYVVEGEFEAAMNYFLELAKQRDAIQGLDRHGLDPEHYRLSRLLALRTDRRARDRVATSAWLMAATHLGYGKLDPVSVEPDWTALNRPSDFGAVLRYALSSRRIATSLEQFAPVQPVAH